MSAKDFFEGARNLFAMYESIAKIAAIVVGGWWAYERFVRQREGYSLIEFTADIHLIGKQGGDWVVELLAFLDNKGKVRHQIGEFTFDLAFLYPTDPLNKASQYLNQLHFPDERPKQYFLDPKGEYFVDPGTKSKYSYITTIPGKARFAMFHVRCTYVDQPATHSAERTIRVPLQDWPEVAGKDAKANEQEKGAGDT